MKKNNLNDGLIRLVFGPPIVSWCTQYSCDVTREVSFNLVAYAYLNEFCHRVCCSIYSRLYVDNCEGLTLIIGVFGTELQGTSPNAACQSPKFPAANKLNIPQFRRSTFGTCRLSQSPVRRFGTHCLIRCVTQPSSQNVLDGTWKRISSPSDVR